MRRPKRFCPGVRGDICTICCGTEREITVDCPLDCVYLREAHQHVGKPILERSHPVAHLTQLLRDQLRFADIRHGNGES